jgi:hypothetical protein
LGKINQQQLGKSIDVVNERFKKVQSNSPVCERKERKKELKELKEGVRGQFRDLINEGISSAHFIKM